MGEGAGGMVALSGRVGPQITQPMTFHDVFFHVRAHFQENVIVWWPVREGVCTHRLHTREL